MNTQVSGRTRGLISLAALLCLFVLPVLAQDNLGGLESNFHRPPPSARPWVYWFWLNGNITSEGITADLEAMQRVGIGGVLIMAVDQGAPAGPAAFGGPQWRRLFHHACVEAHRLGLQINMNNDAGWCGSGGPWVTPALSMQKVVWTQTRVQGPRQFNEPLPQPKAVLDYYRDIAVLAFPTPAGDYRIDRIQGKAFFTRQEFVSPATYPAIPQDEVIPQDRIRNLTARMDRQGRLKWKVPPGRWTILRLGHTSTGVNNHPAPAGGLGLECDKLNPAAVKAQFAGLMGKLIADSRALVPGTLVSTHIDSWEVGAQNWTPGFRKEFRRLRGYDPLRFLPVMTGRVVDSVEVSERFLWDLRQTVSDLLLENYAAEYRSLARNYGMRLSIEAYGDEPCDDMSYAGRADEPMAEFWSYGYNAAYSCLEMASAAHTYGKRILGAESFTATDTEKWLGYPASIKALGDWAFCQGINRFVFHRYALQPWRDRRPGMSMGPWGLHYERTQTWWEESKGWHEYLARCQYLLRHGLFVADVAYLEPEGAPRQFHAPAANAQGRTPDRPLYNYDGCTPEVVLTRMKVRDGRLVLPDGMSYRWLVLPQVATMTPQLLRKIRDLVEAGATVIGPPPRKSPSLADYPECDTQVKDLARQLWGSEDQGTQPRQEIPARGTSAVHQHSLGKGRVLWGGTLASRPPSAPKAKALLADAQWIWFREGNPAVAAPVGKRYFRRAFRLVPDRRIVSAWLALTADNSFDVWINGHKVGTGDNYKQTYVFNVRRLLRPGTNVLAVEAANGATDPNPAGWIGSLTVRFRNHPLLRIRTDRQWEAATHASSDWPQPEVSGQSWSAALELGPLGMAPWGDVTQPVSSPDLYPASDALASLFSSMGVPPDFQAGHGLRYIHRRDGDIDLYFVANPADSWVGVRCAFRVSGKIPELWDPITGKRRRARIFKEEDGRTVLPLWLGPSGSVFVVFRPATRAVRARQDQRAIVALSRDGQSLLPSMGQAQAGRPLLDVLGRSNRRFHLLAWQPGRYALKTKAGDSATATVNSIPAPVKIGGPWELDFPPHWGAPARITLDRLTSWSRHPNPGVKYFSGTATYRTTFTWPSERSSADARPERVYLDLGDVRVIAEVILNGKDLGVLWKPPFRVEVSGALKTGQNTLKVKVTNLWPNRMIGDQHLPEDSDRNPNGTLKAWPRWLEEGRPSPTGRYTFTTWRLWKKNDPLLESGLLGPVTLRSAVELSVQAQ